MHCRPLPSAAATPAEPRERQKRVACAHGKLHKGFSRYSALVTVAATMWKSDRSPTSPRVSKPSGRLQLQQARGIAAKDRGPLLIGQAIRGQNMIDRMLLPRNRVIGPEHDLAGADLRHQMPQPLG